ncbi:type VI secretion system baseplate subunit TssE [Cupriavidus necator]|uniref:Type VI secretion system baseplate subunit TssE n=1 Tax=Cupriavidus necator TaxID=106590 RepID=A0A1U9V228_CUPNE|nr:type VI secretion system baseplate subunit TssE [Cupriavidus necator]AQV98982.1 type VI secretion system baseplate subunit TssE [Cupriavidus necator]
MSVIVNGLPMPLFERLSAGANVPAVQLLQGEPLRQSVARELARLLNTRSRLTAAQFLESDGTVLDYGVPDFSFRSFQSVPDCEAIAALVERAIALFEPRLRNPRARFADRDSPAPVLVIDGDLPLGTALARVAFELAAAGQPADPRWSDHG